MLSVSGRSHTTCETLRRTRRRVYRRYLFFSDPCMGPGCSSRRSSWQYSWHVQTTSTSCPAPSGSSPLRGAWMNKVPGGYLYASPTHILQYSLCMVSSSGTDRYTEWRRNSVYATHQHVDRYIRISSLTSRSETRYSSGSFLSEPCVCSGREDAVSRSAVLIAERCKR